MGNLAVFHGAMSFVLLSRWICVLYIALVLVLYLVLLLSMMDKFKQGVWQGLQQGVFLLLQTHCRCADRPLHAAC